MEEKEKAKDVVVSEDEKGVHSEIEKIRGRWELASILNFLNVFEPIIDGDLKLTAEEIEGVLVQPNKSLAQLHIKLLKGIPPVSKTLNESDAWVNALCKKLDQWWQWVAEGENPLKAAKGEKMSGYQELDPTNRLMILKALCEIRAVQDDIVSYVNDSLKDGTAISYFRKDKVGGNGTFSYWYDGSSVIGHRLYKEVNKAGENIRKKGKASKIPPTTFFQWEVLAINLEEFQKAVSELSSSKVAAEVAAGKTIETDVLPIIEKFQKKKQRAFRQKEREEMLLSNLRSCANGITRSCRRNKPISYTFDDYDRAIDEAIKMTKKRKTIEEQSNERIHVKQGKITSNGVLNVGTSSNEVLGEKSDSDESGSKLGSDQLRKEGNDDDDDDGDDDYDSKKDCDNESGSDKSDKENENCGDKNIAQKFGARWSLRLAGVAGHPVVETRSLGAKNRSRQRPTCNSGLDSITVPDSDDESLSKHNEGEISGHEDLSQVSDSEGCSDS